MWIVTAASIVGTVLNIKRQRYCFVIWLITNSTWCAYNLWIGSYPQAALFAVYVGLSVWGIIQWRVKK